MIKNHEAINKLADKRTIRTLIYNLDDAIMNYDIKYCKTMDMPVPALDHLIKVKSEFEIMVKDSDTPKTRNGDEK